MFPPSRIRKRLGAEGKPLLVFFLSVLASLLVFGFAVEAPVWGQDARGLSLIVVASETGAIEIRDRVRAGASFDTLARVHSLDASSAEGGYLGAVGIEDLRQEFQTALSGMRTGEFSEVIPVDGGYALLRYLTAGELAWVRQREAALAAVEDRQYREATRLVESAIEEARQFADSRLAVSLHDLAGLSRTLGDTLGAVGLYTEALAVWDTALGPGHAATLASLNSLADLHLARGEHAEAAAMFRRSLAIRETVLGPDDPTVAATLNSLGLIAHLAADYAEARSLFERALAIWESALGADHVNVASVLGNLARVDMIEARHVEAERRISRSLDIVERALGPDHPEVARRQAGLAELRGLEGDWKSARGLYERSLEVRWGRGSARQTGVIAVLEQFIDLRGLGLVSDAVRTDAVRRFEEAVAGASPGEDLYRAMAAVLEAEGRKEESQTVLARAVDRFPASRAVRYQLAESAAGLGRIGEAIELLEQARALDGEPQLERVLVREGDLHLDLDRLEEARAAYEGALAVNPGFTPARIGLGEVDFRSGRLEDALGEFAEAVLFDPDDAAAHYRIAEASLRLGRPVEAAAAASRAVELDPEERRARYIQGRALMEVGRIDEGQEAMAEYARLEERARAEHAGVLEVSAIERDVRVRVVAGELGEAIGLLESGVEDHPGAYWLALHLGLLQGASGRVETAVATFESMIERGLGDDPVIRRYLARAWEALGDASASERHEAMSLERLHAELESGLSH